MADKHNKQRYGETWSQERIDFQLKELEGIRPHIILSGGWAWHFISPKGHVELKHTHDHKDIDIFVKPLDVVNVISLLMNQHFDKVDTIYDKLKNNDSFRRYEKTVEGKEKQHKITIDFFVKKDIPSVIIDGWNVVEPNFLLTLYSSIHTSDTCFAVTAAKKLIDKKINPIGNQELVTIPKEKK